MADRTPQAGVEVERKWKREDYRMPGIAPVLVQIDVGSPNEKVEVGVDAVMAKRIEFKPIPADAVEETRRRVQQAPVEHADAVLNAFATLQTLHDANAIDFLRGLAGAGDEVISQVADVATSPQSTRAIRNLLILVNLLGSIDPDTLERIVRSVIPAVTERQTAEPPSMFMIARQLFSRDARRALATGAGLLQGMGRVLGGGK